MALTRPRWVLVISATALTVITVITIGAVVFVLHGTHSLGLSDNDDETPGVLPKRTLTGYWQNFVNGAPAMRLRDISPAYDLVAVGFALADPNLPGAVTFRVNSRLSTALGGYTDTDLKADIDALHARGSKVIISVGGAEEPMEIGDTEAGAAFTASIHSLMAEFGFDGVDIDLEHGIVPEVLSGALRSLREITSEDLIISMAPETLHMRSADSPYLALALSIQDILTVVHVQYYNSGSMFGCDGKEYAPGTVDFVTAQVCIAISAGLRPEQIALGFPATGNATKSGYVTPAVITSALDCLTQKRHCGEYQPQKTWSSLRGVMIWSANWDLAGGNEISSNTRTYLDAIP